jgi:hypothetical protein
VPIRRIVSLTSRILKVCFGVGDYLFISVVCSSESQFLNTKRHQTVLNLFISLGKGLGSREQ